MASKNARKTPTASSRSNGTSGRTTMSATNTPTTAAPAFSAVSSFESAMTLLTTGVPKTVVSEPRGVMPEWTEPRSSRGESATRAKAVSGLVVRHDSRHARGAIRVRTPRHLLRRASPPRPAGRTPDQRDRLGPRGRLRRPPRRDREPRRTPRTRLRLAGPRGPRAHGADLRRATGGEARHRLGGQRRGGPERPLQPPRPEGRTLGTDRVRGPAGTRGH